MKLTKAQQALVERVEREGVVRQNGRARRTVEALQAADAVNVEFDMEPRADAHGNIAYLATVYTLTPKGGAR